MKKIRAAVIGCGWAGGYHAKAYDLHPMVDLVAVCDTDSKNAIALSNHHSCNYYNSLESLLLMEQLDVVSVATPTETHLECVLKCINAGSAVLCEKPLAREVASAETMVIASADAQIPLGVNYNWRYSPAYLKVKEWIEKTGKIRYVNAVLAQNVPIAETEAIRATLPRHILVYDATTHQLDLMRYLIGELEVISAYASSVHMGGIWTEVSVNFRSANGALGNLMCSLSGPLGGNLPIERTEIGTESERMIVNNICQKATWFSYQDNTVQIWRPSIFEDECYGKSLLSSVQAWIDAILVEELPPITGQDGLEAVRLCDRIVKSATEAAFE